MTQYLDVTPEGQDYLRANELYNNQAFNTLDVKVGTNMLATVTPLVALNGFGGALVQGQITINTASVTTNMVLGTLPINIVPQRDTYHPVVVLRSGAYVANAVKVNKSNQEIILLAAPQQNDVVCLDNIDFLVNSYR